MVRRVFNVLFLCTGNSARSIMAEAILSKEAGHKMRAFSAGSHPTGDVHPLARELLLRRGHDVSHMRSKSWDEFAAPGAPQLDVIITVCDNAANETCPVMPGHPMTVHWGVSDPAAVQGSEAARRAAFLKAYDVLARRTAHFSALDFDGLDQEQLLKSLQEIGQST